MFPGTIPGWQLIMNSSVLIRVLCTIPATLLSLLVNIALIHTIDHSAPATLQNILNMFISYQVLQLSAYINQTLLPTIEEVSMKSISSGVIE